jgi:hypothetical protein
MILRFRKRITEISALQRTAHISGAGKEAIMATEVTGYRIVCDDHSCYVVPSLPDWEVGDELEHLVHRISSPVSPVESPPS